MSKDDLTDAEREILAAAGQRDNPRVVEADQFEELEALQNDFGELLENAAGVDDPEVIDATDLEAMNERLAIVESMFDEALVEEKGLREATVEAMSFEAKASEFETEDGDLDVEALTQTPESGSATPTGDGDGDGGVSDEDRERIGEIQNKLSVLGNSLPPERVEALQSEAAELADTDDYDAALEVL